MTDLTYIKYAETPNVIEVTAVASGATAVASTFIKGYYKFIADDDVYIKFGSSAVVEPDHDAEAGTGRCWKFAKDQEKLIYLEDDQTYFDVICLAAVGTTYLRWALELAA